MAPKSVSGRVVKTVTVSSVPSIRNGCPFMIGPSGFGMGKSSDSIKTIGSGSGVGVGEGSGVGVGSGVGSGVGGSVGSGGSVAAGVAIVSGNTVVTGNESITVSVTAAGHEEIKLTAPDDGQDRILVMTGNTGTAGAAMLARAFRDELLTRLPGDFIDKAAATFDDALCAKSALMLAKEAGGCAAMHDVEDGGLFGAVWELCEREKTGCELWINKIPVKQGTIEISEFFDINPYITRGDGAVIAIVPDTPQTRAAGHVIGQITSGKERVVVLGSEKRFLEPNRADDYHKPFIRSGGMEK